MNYSWIKYNDTANGPGMRISLFVSGCRNHCEGCFNKETWDFNHGQPFTDDTLNEILENSALPRYNGLTILGGEPFEPENQPEVLRIIRAYKQRFPNNNIWLFSGYLYDNNLKPGGNRYIEGVTNEILSLADVLCDGKFMQELYDITLLFRGSSNQRIIDLKHSTYENIVFYEPSF